jgi:hypothetical protein
MKSVSIGKKIEALCKSIWPASRRDIKKVLEEVKGCRKLLAEQHEPKTRFITDLIQAIRIGTDSELPEISYNFHRVSRDLALEPPAMSKSEFCVAAVALGAEYGKSIEPCLRTHRDYCRKHGIDYHLLQRTPPSFSDKGPRHPSWGKIAVFNRLFDDGYRYCLYLDADIAITNDALSPQDLLAPLLASDADFMINEEMPYFNCGAILARKTSTVQVLLNAIWNNEKYRLNGAWEQDSILDLIIEYPEIRKKFLLLDSRFLQAVPSEYRKIFSHNEKYLWQPGDFSVHFAHSKGEQLRELMPRYVSLNN